MDEENYVFVKGRIKELIIKGGEKIYLLAKIDGRIISNIQLFLEAAAFCC